MPRSVIVTGHAAGIGAAIAARLAADGWSVTGIDLHASESRTIGLEIAADLSDARAAAALSNELAGADALVHAAGVMRTGRLSDAETGDADRMWSINVRALGILIGGLAPAMPRGGRIVAIGSRTASGASGKGYYAATKAATIALVRSAAAEFVAAGVTANIVSPAATATGMLTQGDRAGIPPVLPPIGRYIDPAEVAALTTFLLGPEAAAITGQNILICGGASL